MRCAFADDVLGCEWPRIFFEVGMSYVTRPVPLRLFFVGASLEDRVRGVQLLEYVVLILNFKVNCHRSVEI